MASHYVSEGGTWREGGISIGRVGFQVGDEDPEESDAAGVLLEDLETKGRLGSGASATVQLVQHKWTNQFYALKVMQLSGDEKERASIMKELRINHKGRSFEHVVQYVGSFYANGEISIILEYMDGGSIADLLARHCTIPEGYLSAIARQALLGLQELHKGHVIHRDIKPSNMLVNRRGQVKISDFGVSAIVDNTLAQANTMVGTYIYMSPERINGKDFGFNSDIWALGLSILECGIGRFPYHRAGGGRQHLSVFQLIRLVLDQPAPQAPADQFSPEFCSFISACLEKDDARRPGAEQLLSHPFILKYEFAGVNVGELCANDWVPSE